MLKECLYGSIAEGLNSVSYSEINKSEIKITP